MPASSRRSSMKSTDLLVALFALGVVLLSWPFLTVVNHPDAVLGIPVLVLYLFAVWGGIIAVLFWLTGGRDTSW
jgi:TRAP-type C4-dicarboxylate transport system permease small subunit